MSRDSGIRKLSDDEIYALEALQRVFGADILYRDWAGLYIQPWQWSSAEHRCMRIPAGTCLDGIFENFAVCPWRIQIAPILLAARVVR